MEIGYSKQLLVLPFDHRATFKEKLLGFKGKLSTSQKEVVSDFKHVVFDAFRLALKKAKTLASIGGILVDEEFGSNILMECKHRNLIFAMPVEKSGRDEFQFEYENGWKKHLLKFNPTFAKALVRFNPQGDKKLNERQLKRLKLLSDFCHKNNVKLMFELLVAPTEMQLKELGSKEVFDKKARPTLMVEALKQIQGFGVKVDVWKLEGLESREQFQKVVGQAKLGGKGVGVIVLGRGEDEKKVEQWLRVGAKVPGVIGFAVGRTVFWKSLEELRDGKISRQRAVEYICSNYLKLVRLWLKARKA